MRLRTISALLSAFLALTGISAAQSSKQPRDARPSFAIVIAVPRAEAAVGTPLLARAKMTNTSSHVIYGGGNMGPAVHIMIFDSAGKEVQETPDWRKKHARDPGLVPRTATIFVAPVKPGQPYTETFNLTEQYDLSKPGKYIIQAQRWDGFSMTLVKSNILSFIITP